MMSSSSASGSTASAPRPSTPCRQISRCAAIARAKYSSARFKFGKLVKQKKGKADEPNGTFVSFSPDPEIFPNYEFSEEHIERRLRFYAYLNAGLRINYNDQRFLSNGGILDLIEDETSFEKIYQPLHYRDATLEFAFTHTNRFNEDYYSFVNGQHTSDGGTHLSGFREGVLRGVNDFAKKKFSGDDVREGLLGAISIRLKDPIFESQTKNKLGNTEIRSEIVARVQEAVLKLLHSNKSQADKLINKIQETQKFRKELNAVKKLARERSKAISIRVPQLRDCKKHYNHAKACTRTRHDLHHRGAVRRRIDRELSRRQHAGHLHAQGQASERVRPQEGCPLQERRNLQPDEEPGYRGEHRQPAVQPRDPGHRCRCRRPAHPQPHDHLLPAFLQSLVERGHLKILETPLFRVRNKKETIYCYSEEERDVAMKKLGRGIRSDSIQRIWARSPRRNSRPSLAKDMRLTPVMTAGDHAIGETLAFYMGKNTQERRNYIMDNLVIDEEILV